MIPGKGAPIIVAPASRNLFHLPSARRDQVSALPVTLAEVLAAGAVPPYWTALCGTRGKADVYGVSFAHCRACPDCVAVLEELAAA